MEAEAVLDAPEVRADPVQRWVWQSRYGSIVIEVRGDDAYVNGQKVVMANAGPDFCRADS